MDRRRFLQWAAASGAVGARSSAAAPAAGTLIDDVSHLNPVRVAGETRPRSTEDVRGALRAWRGRVCVGGGRYSMGGQIAAPGALHLDMRAMNQVVWFEPKRRAIRVQAGMTWRDVQEVIDPHDLSVKIMQSFSSFTVGGSVSVNCHGRYVGRGPLVNAVQAVQLVLAHGEVLELSRTRDAELFAAVFGGYGGLGVITEVELDLDVNAPMERLVQDVSLEDYPAFLQHRVLADSRALLHNADLRPPGFHAPRAITWVATDKPLTRPERLVPRNLNYGLERNAIWAATELPGGRLLRERFFDRQLLDQPAVVWRNHEASLDVAALEPRTRALSTYLLQEYFIPVPGFLSFARRMADILRQHRVNALNVSIRHSPPDRVSLLKWAPTEVLSFVLYYKQRNSEHASLESRFWTRKLIDAALAGGGRYYLPYRPDATRQQFHQAYPEARAFAALKARVDPAGRLSNQLWDRFLPQI